jgi:hypothetical protein
MKLTFHREAGNAKARLDRMHLHSCGQFYSRNGWLMSMLKWNVFMFLFSSLRMRNPRGIFVVNKVVTIIFHGVVQR